MENLKITTMMSENEAIARKKINKLFNEYPMPQDEMMRNFGLFLKRQDLTFILFMDEIYRKILDVQGILIEFGVRWGQTLALWTSLRGIYEPYHYNRTIVGFDTFSGFPSIHPKDGKSEAIQIGGYSVPKNYEDYLSQVLDYHEQESPLSYVKKYKLIKGDAIKTIDKFFKDNPETIIALAFFDFDIYKPTKKCLEKIRDHVTKGSIIVFDQLNYHDFPGETLALKETFGLDKSGR